MRARAGINQETTIMAKDFIKIDATQSAATQAGLLKQYVSALRNAYNLGKQTIAIMGHNNDGTDFTAIEALFGLPTAQGQTVFNLVNGSIGSMEGTFQVSDAKTITEQVG
jgi:hypothetical protein